MFIVVMQPFSANGTLVVESVLMNFVERLKILSDEACPVYVIFVDGVVNCWHVVFIRSYQAIHVFDGFVPDIINVEQF